LKILGNTVQMGCLMPKLFRNGHLAALNDAVYLRHHFGITDTIPKWKDCFSFQ